MNTLWICEHVSFIVTMNDLKRVVFAKNNRLKIVCRPFGKVRLGEININEPECESRKGAVSSPLMARRWCLIASSPDNFCAITAFL